MHLPVSVIIPTMNRPESLGRTLEHLLKGEGIPSQIIIVDQSPDSKIRKANEELVKKNKAIVDDIVYCYQETPSLTKARNQGVTFAQNDIIVFADDDIDVNTDTIANVAKIMNDSIIAMIAGIDELSGTTSSKIGWLFGTQSFFNRKIGHVTASMLGRYPDNIKHRTITQWAMGYFFAVRKTLLEKWGIRWDESLTSYAYAEDLDFSYSYYKYACKEGLACILDPDVSVRHLATLEYRIPSEKSLYMYIINREYLRCKHKKGMVGMLACQWCNFWRLIQNIVNQQKPAVLAKAWLCSIRNHQEIAAGNLDYDKFMK